MLGCIVYRPGLTQEGEGFRKTPSNGPHRSPGGKCSRFMTFGKAHWGFRDVRAARDEAEPITSMLGRQPFSALGYDHSLEFARLKKKKKASLYCIISVQTQFSVT